MMTQSRDDYICDDYKDGQEIHELARSYGVSAGRWSMIKLRKIEKGVTEIELLDLLDIAAYTDTKVEDLLEKTNA